MTCGFSQSRSFLCFPAALSHPYDLALIVLGVDPSNRHAQDQITVSGVVRDIGWRGRGCRGSSAGKGA